jgi:hypothetical protein
MIDIEHNEQKVLEVRKHWFALMNHFLLAFFAAVFPPIVVAGLNSAPGSLQVAGNDTVALLFLYTLWLMLIWLWLFFEWTDYYLDVWIITDQKVISVDQQRLFVREISTLQLDKIQDLTVEVKGIIPTMFHFGDILIQTAGEKREFIMLKIAEPQKVKDTIIHVIEQYNREHFGGLANPHDRGNGPNTTVTKDLS